MSDFSLSHRFLGALQHSLHEGLLIKLVLSKPRPASERVHRVSVRVVSIKGHDQLCFVYSHETRDVTENLNFSSGCERVLALLGNPFAAAHLITHQGQWHWLRSKKGREVFLADATPTTGAPVTHAHDRSKHRWVPCERPFLKALGVTDAHGQVIAAMSRKYKQINKFVEIVDGALQASGLLSRPGQAIISVADFGSGKGYLTFALHDHLHHVLGRTTNVLGLELRAELADFCDRIARTLPAPGLRFEAGDVRTYGAPTLDVMVALHACDTATDHAMALGVRAQAQVIVCSPCCHQEIRPQLLSPHPLRAIFRHGVHLGQEAEMLTDSLRALLLEAHGYETKIFEFVSLEHTQKNKMILAIKRPTAVDAAKALAQVREIKSFYGVQHHCLEHLLMGS